MISRRVIIALLAFAAALYAAVPYLGISELGVLAARDLLQLAAVAGATILCAWAATRAGGMQRAGWIAMALASGAWTLGQVAWTFYEVVLGVAAPIPSWSDAGFLSIYPAAFVGVTLLAHPRRARFGALVGPVADGLLIAGALFLLAWPIFLHDVYGSAGGTGAAALAIAYVVGDIILIGLTLSVLGRAAPGSRAQPATLLAAFALVGVGDTSLAFGVLGEGYATGGLFDLGWILGCGTLALAARGASTPEPPRGARSIERALPIAAIGVGVLSYAPPMDHQFDYLVQGWTFAATTLVATARQVVHGREHARLAREHAVAFERLSHAERIASMGSWRLDLATNEIDWSQTSRELLRLPRGARGPTFEEILAGLDLAIAEATRAKLAGPAASITEGSFEVLVTRADGTRIWVRTFYEPERAKDGTLVALRGTMQDIHEKKVAQIASEAANELTRALFDAMPAMIVVTDATGKIIRWNSELERAAGWTAEDLARMSALDLVHPDERPAFQAQFKEAFENGTATMDAQVMHKNGSTQPALLVGRRFGDPSAPLLVGVAVDVSARRRAEDALRRNERLTSLGTLVAGVAHEINNPLTYIRGGVEFIEQNATELTRTAPALAPTLEAMVRDAESALRGLDRIAAITAGLRRVARSPAAVRKPILINAIVEEIIPIARPRFGPNVAVETDLQSRDLVLASAEEVSQVILNLFFNAGDAMREKGGTLRVTTRDAGGDVILDVADTGAGIPWDKQAQLFTPFFTTKPEGTGLGLSVSRAIVLDHGGDVTFDSAPGRGSTFHVRFPAHSRALKVTS